MAALTEAVSGPAGVIGRYFSVLSVIPSILLVTYVYALGASGAFAGHPQWSRALKALGDLGIAGSLQIALVSLLVGLVLQPLQFASVQLLEGYWGTGRMARVAMTWRIRAHRDRRARLILASGRASAALKQAGYPSGHTGIVRDEHLHLLVLHEEAARLAEQYPDLPNDVRPTRLGNVLRRHEVRAGRPYGLPAITVAPSLALVAAESDVDYLDDSRTTMDLAVRLSVVCGIATLVSVVMLWRSGPLMLVALIPYALMYLFYRGAVVLAGGYGAALAALIHLNRFALYERLRLRLPRTTVAELRQNAILTDFFGADPQASLHYVHPEPSSPSAPGGP